MGVPVGERTTMVELRGAEAAPRQAHSPPGVEGRRGPNGHSTWLAVTRSAVGDVRARLGRLSIRERPVRVGVECVFVDSVDRALAAAAWMFGATDRREQRLLACEVRAGMVAVDVGANVGWYTMRLARLVGPAGRVIAVEPEPGNFRLLAGAVRAKRLEHVEARQVAAGDGAGWMTLYLSEVDRGDHRIFPAADERRLVTVRAVNLDDLLADQPRVDFIKLSVQGAEVSALRGLRRTLARHPSPRVLCTVCPALLERAGAGPAALFDPLRAAGFVPHLLTWNGVPEPVNETVAWSMARAAGRISLYFVRAA